MVRAEKRRSKLTRNVTLRALRRWLFAIVSLQCVAAIYLYGKIALKGPQVDRQKNTRREGGNHVRPREPYGNSENSWEHQANQEERKRQNFMLEQNRDALDAIKRNKKLLPCQWNNKDCGHDTNKEKRSIFFFQPMTQQQGMVAFNSFPHDRYWCQQFIPANGGLVEFEVNNDEPCHEPPRLFYKTPTVSGKGLKPTTVWYNDPDHLSRTETIADCKVPCRVGGDFELVSRVTISNTPFQFIVSMEGEAYYSNLKIKPTAYQDHLYYATTSFRSEVPAPYYSEAEYPRLQTTPAVDYATAIKGASFLANNCGSFSKREELVQALQQRTRFRVDSLSTCLHNAELPPGIPDSSNKGLILSKYLFHLSFENQRADDYITEKLWGALQSGTIPVYLGAPNIKDHVPPHSIISVDDFDTPLALANYLSKVSKDKSLYQSYHKWRQQPNKVWQHKYNFTKQHSKCRLCQWGYANKYGFAWNHTHQVVQEPMIARKTCRNKKGMIGYPFKEYWKKDNRMVPVVSNGSSVKTCTIDNSNRLLDIDRGAMQRAVYTQDGVTDFLISGGDTSTSTGMGRREEEQQSTYILTLETPIRSTELQKSIDHEKQQSWWLQDGQSRMTILILTSQPGVELRLVKSGTVSLAISSPSSLIRVRVISEDVDDFHKGAKTRPNYFGKLLTDDFFHPLETYKVA
jgi:hypothetical protein